MKINETGIGLTVDVHLKGTSSSTLQESDVVLSEGDIIEFDLVPMHNDEGEMVFREEEETTKVSSGFRPRVKDQLR